MARKVSFHAGNKQLKKMTNRKLRRQAKNPKKGIPNKINSKAKDGIHDSWGED